MELYRKPFCAESGNYRLFAHTDLLVVDLAQELLVVQKGKSHLDSSKIFNYHLFSCVRRKKCHLNFRRDGDLGTVCFQYRHKSSANIFFAFARLFHHVANDGPCDIQINTCIANLLVFTAAVLTHNVKYGNPPTLHICVDKL